MAWKIATASGISRAQNQPGRPLTFLQAAGFQWVNPQQPVNKVTRRSAGDPSRLNRAASRRSSLRFGRNTHGIPPSRALSAGRLPPSALTPLCPQTARAGSSLSARSVRARPSREISRGRGDHADLRLRELSLRLALDPLRGRNGPAPEASAMAPALQFWRWGCCSSPPSRPSSPAEPKERSRVGIPGPAREFAGCPASETSVLLRAPPGSLPPSPRGHLSVGGRSARSVRMPGSYGHGGRAREFGRQRRQPFRSAGPEGPVRSLRRMLGDRLRTGAPREPRGLSAL